MAATAERDGRYVLGTNDAALGVEAMLAASKRRGVPERGYTTIIGPLAIRPVDRHMQQRLLGLVFCTMVALLVYALREVLACRTGFP